MCLGGQAWSGCVFGDCTLSVYKIVYTLSRDCGQLLFTRLAAEGVGCLLYNKLETGTKN